jgi:hypothetical protein
MRMHAILYFASLLGVWTLIAHASLGELALFDAPSSRRDTPPECRTDDDCVLVPSLMSCCGECPATPPFEAAPREMLEELRRELDDSCARRACEPVTCERTDCTARASCRLGRCEAIAGE